MISQLSKTDIQAESTTSNIIQESTTEQVCKSSSVKSMWDRVLVDNESDNEESDTFHLNAIESAKIELQKYSKMKRIDISEDPLLYWSLMKSELPTLANLEKVYLCSPSSSTTNEREFKVSKLIQKDRIRLTTQNVETLLFLKYNLRALSYSTYLCDAPEDFTPPNSKYYDVWDTESSESEEET
ncbi:zinc finger BED domain-containing protein 6-like [Hydra vulgaris]|uniref:zinc finger BED domain-containing protein 6-like n=1 Tax=Hydra vulgaris TaxID=6087 RepID=UPI0032E9E0FC